MESVFKIEWRKWADPFKNLFDSYKREQVTFEKHDFSDLKEYQGPVVMTPHGPIPINESNLPSTVFNFWRADTNFWMTKPIEYIINTTLGVEAFNLITPLRFRIAVGTLFDEADVKNRVSENITDHLNKVYKSKGSGNKNLDMEILAKQFDFFAIVDGPVNQIVHGSSKEEVLKKIQDIKPELSSNIRYSWTKNE